MLVPLLYLSFTMKGTLGDHPVRAQHTKDSDHRIKGSSVMLTLGVGGLVFVPVFKTLVHMPPYIGMMLALGILWVVSEFINPHADEALRKPYTAAGALQRIDSSSILFFLGILLAVSALESMHILQGFAGWLDQSVGNRTVIITLVGLLSAVIDNVPLVAASMGMYSLEAFPIDNFIWEYLAYCAGTGGSILIIGSAAGVAVMGMERIDFIWYMKRISLLAALGYFAGCGAYLILYDFLH
jgi:Na+/H+ antiporter NhaD/arsenite permease-like protein